MLGPFTTVAFALALAASAFAGKPAKADTLCDLDGAACDSRAAEAPEAARALPVEAIRRIVREYLIEHPEVLLEAEQALRAKRAEEEARRDRAAIREHRDALFADPEAPVAGNPDGALALVEFFDYRCGYCRRVKPVLDTLLAENGDLRLIYKEFPILGPESTLAARAALASRAQGGYAAFHDALMEAEEPLDHARVFETARAVGLDEERLARDMADPAVDAALARNAALAEALGIGRHAELRDRRAGGARRAVAGAIPRHRGGRTGGVILRCAAGTRSPLPALFGSSFPRKRESGDR